MDGPQKLFKLEDEEKSILKPLVEEGVEPKTRLIQINQDIQNVKMNSTLAKII